MKIKKMLVIGLSILCLAGCTKKIPAGISEEVYEKGQKSVEITKDFLEEKKTRREAVDELIDLSKKIVAICEKENDERDSKTEYTLDAEVAKAVLLISQNMVTEGGDDYIESSLETLEELLQSE